MSIGESPRGILLPIGELLLFLLSPRNFEPFPRARQAALVEIRKLNAESKMSLEPDKEILRETST
jgi:hypothetical protein